MLTLTTAIAFKVELKTTHLIQGNVAIHTGYVSLKMIAIVLQTNVPSNELPQSIGMNERFPI